MSFLGFSRLWSVIILGGCWDHQWLFGYSAAPVAVEQNGDPNNCSRLHMDRIYGTFAHGHWLYCGWNTDGEVWP